jgi:hypothetical protein
VGRFFKCRLLSNAVEEVIPFSKTEVDPLAAMQPLPPRLRVFKVPFSTSKLRKSFMSFVKAIAAVRQVFLIGCEHGSGEKRAVACCMGFGREP